MSDFMPILREHSWLLHLLYVLLITVLLQLGVSRLINQLIKKAKKTKIIYDDALLIALKAPISLLIWTLGLCFAAEMLGYQLASDTLLIYTPKLKTLAILLAASWGVIRFIHNLETLYIHHCAHTHKEVDKTLLHASRQIATVSIVMIALLMAMPIFGLPVSGLLAFGGLGGAAIAFASRDLLANFFGSLVIYLDRPFKLGDWIRSPDKPIEGVVEFIGWRVTRIRTFDKRPLYVPNSLFLTISVENPSRMTNRRIKAIIGIRYQDASKMDAITEQVKQMLMQHPDIDTQQLCIVNFVEFGKSSLNFMVYTFTKTTNWGEFQAVQHDVFMKIIGIVVKNKADFAFPTQTLFVQNDEAEMKKE